MGWWSITDKDGGISTLGNIGLYGGDDPSDVIGSALKKIIKQYEDEFGRKPYVEEIQAAWNFSTRSFFDEQLDNAPRSILENMCKIADFNKKRSG